MKGENVDFSVAKALFQALSGFRGYPRPGIGEDHFVEAFQSVVISVAHARAVIASFDGTMPTIREIKDSAIALRPKFEITVDQRKEWEAKSGKPDPMWSANLVHNVVDAAVRKQTHIEEKRAVLWQAIRDSIYYTENALARSTDLGAITDDDERINAFKFWRQAAKRNQREHPTEVTAFRLELERDGWDKLMEYDWTRGIWPPAALRKAVAAPGPITQADINRELRAQGREPGDNE